MGTDWTFGRKVATGFAAVVALTLVMGLVAVWALGTVVQAKDEVIVDHGNRLLKAQRLATAMVERVASNRAYLLAPDDARRARIDDAHREYRALLDELATGETDPGQKQKLKAVEDAGAAHWAAATRLMDFRDTQAPLEDVAERLDRDVAPLHRTAVDKLDVYLAEATKLRDLAKQDASSAAAEASNMVIGFLALAALVAGIVAWVLVRNLSRQIGSVVQRTQSSAKELQAAANQQAAASREQVSALQETQTTMKELLATSRQIGESARHVAEVAREARTATEQGEATVNRGQESMGVVRKQVDAVVNQMLDLGRKSQQIGGVLELINELSDQTNILAINATIEAAGAEGGGTRFAAVADEIRSLADRVGGSTREIRSLIEEVRSSVNASVMATESVSKSVDSGSRQFDDVATSFNRIASLVHNTAEAGREIELSTNQQVSAVEQVNTAVADVSQASQEADVSARQTLETSGQLTVLATELLRLVQSGNGNGR